MSFPRYPKYKDSGVEWLGEVPEHWGSVAIKHVVATPVTDGPHETPPFSDEGVPFVSAEAVSTGRIDFAKIRGFISEADHNRYCQKYKPQVGDIYMVKSGASTGTTAIVDDDREFSIWSPLAAIRCNSDSIPTFVLNFLRSRNFQEAVALNWSFGTQQNIGMNVIENLHVTIPPLPEQHAIAAFLDRETSKIDALVAEQRQLIELLKEKRQAVISHAVTKGLNPDVAMKDSGIEWLGMVPEHWEVKRLKYVSPQITVGIVVEPSKFYVGEGVPALRSLNVDQGKVNLASLIYISEEGHELHCKSKLRAGDLVAVRSGQTGTTAVIPKELDGCNCVDLIIIRKPIVGSEWFLCWFLASDAALAQFSLGSGGAIQQHFNIGTASELEIPVPPEDEQYKVAEYVNCETRRIDTLTATSQRAIDLLQERRTALISAAVTGKIDVRDLSQSVSVKTIHSKAQAS